jgi:hypothetical protein
MPLAITVILAIAFSVKAIRNRRKEEPKHYDNIENHEI